MSRCDGGGGHCPSVSEHNRRSAAPVPSSSSAAAGTSTLRSRSHCRPTKERGGGGGLRPHCDRADSMADWPTNSRGKEQTVTFTLLHWSESSLDHSSFKCIRRGFFYYSLCVFSFSNSSEEYQRNLKSSMINKFTHFLFSLHLFRGDGQI